MHGRGMVDDVERSDHYYVSRNEHASYMFLAELLLHHPEKCLMDQVGEIIRPPPKKRKKKEKPIEPAIPLIETITRPTESGHRILAAVCTQFNVNKAQIFSKYRPKRYVQARHIACWMIRRHTLLTLTQVGKIVGNRDHTTVMHGVQVIERRRKTEPELVALIGEIEVMLGLQPT